MATEQFKMTYVACLLVLLDGNAMYGAMEAMESDKEEGPTLERVDEPEARSKG